jgi:hypothetical protein
MVLTPGIGGHGIASEFGDLTGLTRQEVAYYLEQLGATAKTTQGGYVEYKFPDRSKVFIRPDSEIVRTPAPKYDAAGRNINKGLRLRKDGGLLLTSDKIGNRVPGTHNTGEFLRN